MSKEFSQFPNGDPPVATDRWLFGRVDGTSPTGFSNFHVTFTQLAAAIGSGGGAPVDAEYIVGALHAGLSAERLVTDNAEIIFDLATLGQLKANVGIIAQAKVTNLVVDLAGKEATGVAAALMAAHVADADPHPQYLTVAEGNATYDALGAAAARQQNIQFKDEGVNQGAAGAVGIVNFVGAGVAAVEAGGTLTVTIAGGGGGSADIVAATANVAVPTMNAEVVIVDAAITPTDRINVNWGNCAQTDANHPSMGEVAFNAIAGTGQFILEIFSLDQSQLFGDFKINYMRAA